eukprot:4836676-Pyramimonas_sp.AAC.1
MTAMMLTTCMHATHAGAESQWQDWYGLPRLRTWNVAFLNWASDTDEKVAVARTAATVVAPGGSGETS